MAIPPPSGARSGETLFLSGQGRREGTSRVRANRSRTGFRTVFPRSNGKKEEEKGEEEGWVERGRMKGKEKIMEEERKGEGESEKGGKKKKKEKKKEGRDVGLSQYLLSLSLSGKEVSTFHHFMANGISSGRRWNSNVRISYPLK